MAILPKRSRMRNSNQLSLFDWQAPIAPPVFDSLLITRKLAREMNISPAVLNVMAEAHGYTGREGSND
ncbi:MAG: hypothetical protein ABJ281_08570 [Lentilitoribacter sp.]